MMKMGMVGKSKLEFSRGAFMSECAAVWSQDAQESIETSRVERRRCFLEALSRASVFQDQERVTMVPMVTSKTTGGEKFWQEPLHGLEEFEICFLMILGPFLPLNLSLACAQKLPTAFVSQLSLTFPPFLAGFLWQQLMHEQLVQSGACQHFQIVHWPCFSGHSEVFLPSFQNSLPNPNPLDVSSPRQMAQDCVSIQGQNWSDILNDGIKSCEAAGNIQHPTFCLQNLRTMQSNQWGE